MMLAKLKELWGKKVGPVPVPVLVFIAALGLAYYAYTATRTAGTSEDITATEDAAGGEPGSGGELLDQSNPIFLAGGQGGTSPAIAGPVGDVEPVTGTPADDNSTWLQKAVAYVVNLGYDGTTANNALSKYLEGESLSFEEGRIRDIAVSKFGVPPEAPAVTTTELYNGPASKQGVPPLTHKVIGSSDNQPSELALLYYGTASDAAVRLIKSAGDTRDVYAVGDRVSVPAPLPNVASPVIAPLAQQSNDTIINTKYATGQQSLTTVPDAVKKLQSPLSVTVYKDETLGQFQARMVKQYGFTPSVVTLKRLNTSATDKAYLDKMEFGRPHNQGTLDIN